MRRTLLAAALALSAACGSGRPYLARSWVLGKPLDLGATTLQGEPVAVGGANGHVRAVVLWASWCRACYDLFPALDVVAASGDGRTLSITAIAVDEDPEKVRVAAGRLPGRVRVLWDRGAERLGERLGVEELPTILILDRAGVVRHFHEGNDPGLVRQVDAELRALLRE